MNKIAYLIIIILLSMTPLTAAEKKNCTGIKKLSKAFIACKTGNFRTGVINTGSSIKKNTKKKSVASTEKIKASTVKLKIFLKNFKKSTKQYPKGTQK